MALSGNTHLIIYSAVFLLSHLLLIVFMLALCSQVGRTLELEDDQRAALRAGSRQVRRAAALLRSVNPESFKAAEEAKRVCDLVWKGRVGEPAAEDVAKGFAGLLRYCPTLGPGTQEVIENALERLVDRMGLTCEVKRALEAPQEKGQGRSR